MVEQYGRVKRFLPALLRDLHFRAVPAGEHTLAALYYLTELNGSKKRILDDAPEHTLPAPGNAWFMMRRDGFNAQVIHCVCWSDFRIHCGVVISGLKTASAGVIRVRSCFRGKNGWPSGSQSVVRLGIPLTAEPPQSS